MTSRNSLAISLGSCRVDRAIHADHSAKRRHRIAFERLLVSLGERLAGSGSARIGVLDDGADWLVELLRQIPRRLQIDNIVVGKLFALQLAPLATPAPEPSAYIAAFWCGFSP